MTAAKCRRGGVGRRLVAPGDPRRAIPGEPVAHQQLRVERGLGDGDAGGYELRPGGVDEIAETGHRDPRYFFAGSASGVSVLVTSFRRSDWKNVDTASSISASSPFSTVGSWWLVKPTRWSVIRLCGKL